MVTAARAEFAEHGYGGASVRTIARRAGVSLSALYHWFPGKQDLLAAILEEDLEHYFAACSAALEDCGPSATERLRALVATAVRYRVDHPVRASVVVTEGRSLAPEQRERHLVLLERASDQFRQVIEDGRAVGEFVTPYPEDARRAIIAACNAIAQWYHPGGDLGVDDLVERYAAIALSIVGATS
jgi:AcrR family transcriptional regulator